MFWNPFAWMLVFTRASAMFAVFPLTSAQSVPAVVRIALGALTAALISPSIPTPDAIPSSLLAVAGILFVEASVGLLFGFVSRIAFYAIEAAGSLIALEMGLMLSSVFNPLGQQSGGAPSLALYWLGAMILFAVDGHHWLLAAFRQSYEFLPPGGAGMGEVLLLDCIRRTSSVFVLGVQMTAPILATAYVIVMLFSLLSRAVPQMNVFSESFPVRTLAGLMVFGLTCPLIGQHMANSFRRLPDDIHRIARLLAG